MLKRFFEKESATGILLIIATMLAMLFANSPMAGLYQGLLDVPMVVSAGTFHIAKPLLLWVNDGLMAIFFFMVGLEIKREMLAGNLKEPSKVVLPALAALGGMIAPAIIYWFFNRGNPLAISGWAIPMATDIAFALGVLSLLGNRVPVGLKIFLLALAIIDDVGAILVIAFFYTQKISAIALIVSATAAMILLILNRRGATNVALYVLIGVVMWAAVLKSGVHATIAGVLLGLMIPYKGNEDQFKALEHSLHVPVNYMILPVFAFVNTGVGFGNVTVKDFTDTVTLGIAMGLFGGKTVGIYLFAYLGKTLKLGQLPDGVDLRVLLGVAMLGGIGFTMSLFIGSLAFERTGTDLIGFVDERIGILMGSLMSGIAGYLFLSKVLNGRTPTET